MPGPIYSGDSGGYNMAMPGDITGTNYVLSGTQVGLTLPDGVAAVSFSATADATANLEVAFVDQWIQTRPGEIQQLDWWSTGPTVIWLDGGIGGMVADDPNAGPNSGALGFAGLAAGPHYFVAYVTAAEDGPLAFAYTDPAPEPATWILVLGGMALGLAWKARRQRVAEQTVARVKLPRSF
jgi:hypothetical protein